MRKRKVNFKRPKTENTNRPIALYTGKPLPFAIGYATHEQPDSLEKPRKISWDEWQMLVRNNEQKNRKKKKKK